MRTLTLIGVGLIGGSLALDLRALGWRIVAVDNHRDNLQAAFDLGIIDEGFTEINDQIPLDYVILATPVSAVRSILQALKDLLAPNTIISDVGSTKQQMLDAFGDILPDHLPRCVAAHPIAGSDQSGARAARQGLFAGKKVIVCPHDVQEADSLNQICALWQSVGAQVVSMSAMRHDEIFSQVSHLPHLLAYTLTHQIAHHPDRDLLLNFAASGFRDFSRIAASHPQMWADICLANRRVLLQHLADFQNQLDVLKQAIADQDKPALLSFFAKAKETREQWQSLQK